MLITELTAQTAMLISEHQDELKSIYKNYRKTIVKLLPKVSNKKEKLYLRLFYANINLYILLRYRIMGKDIRR